MPTALVYAVIFSRKNWDYYYYDDDYYFGLSYLRFPPHLASVSNLHSRLSKTLV